MVKRIIKNLITIIFYSSQYSKLLLEVSDLIIVKEKLIIVIIHSLVYYIFLKISL